MKFRTSSIIEFIIRLRVIIVQQKYSFGISFRNVVTDVYRDCHVAIVNLAEFWALSLKRALV